MAAAKSGMSKAAKTAKTRADIAARRSKKLRVPLPRYRATGWRKKIFDISRDVAAKADVRYDETEKLDLVVRLYLRKSLLEKNDVDNRLKDVFDGLQGALAGEGKPKKYKKGRLIHNDKHIYRALVEKVLTPKKYLNRPDARGSGGSVTIRRWRQRAEER